MKERYDQSCSDKDIDQVCPPGLPPGRDNDHLHGLYFRAPYPGNIGGIDLQQIVAWWQLRIAGNPLVTGVHPTVIEILQPVTVADLLGTGIFVACKFKAQEVLVIRQNELIQSVEAAVDDRGTIGQ